MDTFRSLWISVRAREKGYIYISTYKEEGIEREREREGERRKEREREGKRERERERERERHLSILK